MVKPQVTDEQKALLEGHNFPLRRLFKHDRFDHASVSLHSLLPWTYFTSLLGCLCLYWPRYEHPHLAMLLCWVLSIMFIGNALITVIQAWRGTRAGRVYHDMHWPIFSLAMLLIAWGVATTLGQKIYWGYVHKYYDLENLQEYASIDPSAVSGKQIQDAGRIYFTPNAYLDRTKAGCYVKGKTYCIAPIVIEGDIFAKVPQFGSYDYFAVGVDCCSCPDRDFRCGEYNNPLAAAGLRYTDDNERIFYNLAVDAWTSTYTTASVNPLFFEWTAHPRQRQIALRDTGIAIYILAIVLGFVSTLTLAIASNFLMAKPESVTKSTTPAGAGDNRPAAGV